ncbi:MAG: SDR family oxidoreductase, partial [Myxococcota bacterium]
MSDDRQINGHDVTQHSVPPAPAPLEGAGSSEGVEVLEQLLSVQKTLSGRRLLITGSTGFLAKVLVSMVLRYHPDIEQLYIIIRQRPSQTAYERFLEEVVENPTFDPLREIYGAGLHDFIAQKVTVFAGDLTQRFLGLDPKDATAVSCTLDLFINSAGLTNFNPNLESALNINTLSEYNILEFLELGDFRASLLHVSTAFVAGNTDDPVPEVPPGPYTYPAVGEVEVSFDHLREIEDCQRMIAYTKHMAEDQERASLFAKDARERMRKRNLDPKDEQAYQRAFHDAKRAWIKNELSQRGRQRAAHWGWPNIYTYTKSMGERLLVDHADRVNMSISRPAVIESAMSYPIVGWNEGINTCAPLAYLRYKGQRYFPMHPDYALDVIPVDYVCGALLSISAALLERRAEPVYHLGSSDLNPFPFERLVELTTLASRKIRKGKVNQPKLQKAVLDMIEGTVVPKSTFDTFSAPGLHKALGGLKSLLSAVPKKKLGVVGGVLDKVERQVSGLE